MDDEGASPTEASEVGPSLAPVEERVQQESQKVASEPRSKWYIEHTALFVTTTKWAILGTISGLCVGIGTKFFLWSLAEASAWLATETGNRVPPYLWLPLSLPLCVFLIRTFAPEAQGHGTEAVIEAVHQRSGRISWKVAPVKLLATILTLATGGSVGKEGPCAQIGAAVSSLFADVLRLADADRRRLVICGISAGFAAVFGTPVSGALFGIEVLYLGRIEYSVLFPSLLAGIMAHLVCDVSPPVVNVPPSTIVSGQFVFVLLTLGLGVIFGLVALLFIELTELIEARLHHYRSHPYQVACFGGALLVIFFFIFGALYSGLGVETIEAVLHGGNAPIAAGLLKMLATAVTLEVGGSGGILTPLFFIGTTVGAAIAQLCGLPISLVSAFGFISLLGASTNTPIAAAVMGMEILPGPVGVYAALSVCAAYLIVGHRSVYPSQRIGFAKSAGLEFDLDVPIGEVTIGSMRVREGSLTKRVSSVRKRLRKRVDGKKGGEEK
ncbi:MAG: chloride channel protein [Bdellovibrionota bacterium]